MSTNVEPARISPLRRLLLAGLVLAGLLVVLAVVARLQFNLRSASRLQTATDALDAVAPGWRLNEIDATYPAPPAAENSALVVEAVLKALPKGHAITDLDERNYDPAHLDAELAKVRPALLLAQQLAALPNGKFEIDYGVPPPLMRFDRIDHVRLAGLLCRLDALNFAEKGDPKQALLCCRAALNAARSVGDEPFLHAQMTRCSEVGHALTTIDRVLRRTEASGADLAAVAELVTREERHPTGRVKARGVCGDLHATFLWLELNPPTAQGMKALLNTREGYDEWRDDVFGVSVSDLRYQHAVALELFAQFIPILDLPLHDQKAAEDAFDKVSKPEMERYRFVGMLMPGMSRANLVARRKLGNVRAMLTLLQAERYRLKQGKWPDKLPDAPLDPFDGKPVRYKRTADGVVAYVIGEDCHDDGGEVDLPASGGGPRDWGYRLLDDRRRR